MTKFQQFLFAVMTDFGRAFGATAITYVIGILAAPNLTIAVSLSIGALTAAISAGLRAVQVWIPRISFAGIIRQPYAAWADSFSRAGIAGLIVSVTGWLAAPDLATWRSAGLAAVIGALSLGFRAVQGGATPGESPAPEKGIGAPKPA